MKPFLIFITLLFISVLSAQSKDPDKILNSVKAKFEKIHDYEADLSIKIDINFVKVPETKAKVFFKQPDKTKIHSEGFAMLPKQSRSFSPAQLLKGDYTALFVRTENVKNKMLDVIKIIPNSDTSDVILTTLWIDTDGSIIKKIETTGKKGGTVHIELSYTDEKFALPSTVKFSFNLGDIQMPDNLSDNNDQRDRGGRRNRGPIKGTVTMTYMNYKINKGIPDSFFEEKIK